MPFDSNGVFSLTPGYLAVTGETILPTNHNPPLEDIAAQGLSSVLVRDGRAPMTGNLNMGNFKLTNLLAGTATTDGVNKGQMDTAVTAGALVGVQLKGYLYGLTLANNATDATNDIDIAVGAAAADAGSFNLIQLNAPLTKRLDAAWAVGTGNGGLDTGSIANTTYHVWLIQRSDTGVVDALFSTSATSPTMPTNYDRKRRIGSIMRESAAIAKFVQLGDRFWRDVQVQDVVAINPGSSAVTRTLSVPVGIVVEAFGLAQIITTTLTATSKFFLISSLDQTDSDPDVVGGTVAQSTLPLASSAAQRAIAPFSCKTNTSAQVRSRLGSSAAANQISMNTFGWIDTRGRG